MQRRIITDWVKPFITAKSILNPCVLRISAKFALISDELVNFWLCFGSFLSTYLLYLGLWLREACFLDTFAYLLALLFCLSTSKVPSKLIVLQLVKLLTMFEHHCCSRKNVRMKGGGNPPLSPPSCFWSSKTPVSDTVKFWFQLFDVK